MAESEQPEELHRVPLARVDLRKKYGIQLKMNKNTTKEGETDLFQKGAVVKVEREVGQRVCAEVDAAARLKEGDNDEKDMWRGRG